MYYNPFKGYNTLKYIQCPVGTVTDQVLALIKIITLYFCTTEIKARPSAGFTLMNNGGSDSQFGELISDKGISIVVINRIQFS